MVDGEVGDGVIWGINGIRGKRRLAWLSGYQCFDIIIILCGIVWENIHLSSTS